MLNFGGVQFPRFFPGGASSRLLPGRSSPGLPRPWVFSGNLLASGKPSETLKSWPDAEGMSTLGSMNDSLWRSLLDERLDWDGVSVFLGGVGWEIGLGDGVCIKCVCAFFFVCVFFLSGFLAVIWGYFVHVSDGSYSPVTSMNVH